MAYGLLGRSHLQQIGYVKGTQSGYVELILSMDLAYILFSKSRKIAGQPNGSHGDEEASVVWDGE